MANAVQSTNSGGLMRPGHFTSSKRAMELHEPIYLNLFTITIAKENLPTGLVTNDDETNIILEGVRSISGLDTQPGMQADQQKYKFAERNYATSKPSKTSLDLQINFELNLDESDESHPSDYTYKFLRGWSDLIYNPQTGYMTIKKNYVCSLMTITMQDKNGTPYHQWECHNIFPTTQIPSFQLNYDSGIQQAISMTFKCDYFDEVWY